MKKSLIVLSIFSAFSIFGCATAAKPPRAEANTRSIDKIRIYQMPLYANMEVKSTKVTATVEGSSTEITRLKKLASYEALKKVNGDVMIEPQYDIDASMGKAKVTVSGYVGVYTSFNNRPYIPEFEVDLVVQNTVQPLNIERPATITNQTQNIQTISEPVVNEVNGFEAAEPSSATPSNVESTTIEPATITPAKISPLNESGVE